jgi:large subunit ribosomal protein L25
MATGREQTEIAAEPRQVFGKKVRALRRQGFIPARISQRDGEDIFIQMDEKVFQAAYRKTGLTGVLSIALGRQVLPAMVQRIERHAVRPGILHVDLIRVDLLEPVTADVPVIVTGEAPAEKATVGFLLRQTETVTVRALPTALPRSLEADVSSLQEVGDKILAQDLQLPPGVELVSDPELLLASVARAGVEVPEAAAAEEEKAEEREGAAEAERTERGSSS